MAFSCVQRYKDDPRMEADMSEKVIGKAKEAYGALVGDEAKKAERQRDEQERKDKGPLGGLTDTLTGL